MENRKAADRALLNEMKKLHHQMPRWVIVVIILSAVAAFTVLTSTLMVILIIACMCAYILSDLINKMVSFGLKRSVSVVMLYVALAGFLVGAEIKLSPYLEREVKNFYEKLPYFAQRIESVLSKSSSERIKDYPLAEEVIRKVLKEMISPGLLIDKAMNFTDVFSQAAPFVLGLILVPFFVFFLLKDWPEVLKKIMGWIPPLYVETTVSVLSEINILVGKYLRGLAIDCISVGVIAAAGLWLIGINFPISLGIFTGAANVIPYLGPIISCIAACLIAFVQFNQIGIVINIMLLYASIKLMDDLLIQPLTIGKSVQLHPMLLVITIIGGEKLFGITGMVLAVPIVTAAQKVLHIIIENRRMAAVKASLHGVKERAITVPQGNIPL